MLKRSKFFKWNTQRKANLLTDIVLSSVSGDLRHADDLSSIVCVVGAQLNIKGTVAIADQDFALALRRTDNGELINFNVSVIDGAFDATLVFDSATQYVYDNAMANRDLPEPLFNTKTITVDVVAAV